MKSIENEITFVGIDVSKNKLDLALSNTKSHFEYSNNSVGIKNIIKELSKYSIGLMDGLTTLTNRIQCFLLQF